MSSVLPKDYFIDLEQFPNSDVSFVWEIIGSLDENLISLIHNSDLPEGEKLDMKGLQADDQGVVSTGTFISSKTFKPS